MTSAAAILRSHRLAHMLCVVKLHVETLFEAGGKALERSLRCIYVRVADKAHRTRGSEKLIPMAIDTRGVARERWLRRVILALMT